MHDVENEFIMSYLNPFFASQFSRSAVRCAAVFPAAQRDGHAVIIIARRTPILPSARRQCGFSKCGLFPGGRTHPLKCARPVSSADGTTAAIRATRRGGARVLLPRRIIDVERLEVLPAAQQPELAG